MSESPDVLKRALVILNDQCNEAEGRALVLARAVTDIEKIAADYMDLGREDLSSILHICHTGGVKAALEVST